MRKLCWISPIFMWAMLLVVASCNNEKMSTNNSKEPETAELLRLAKDYASKGQRRTSEFYWWKVLDVEPTDSASLFIYCDAAASLANTLVNKGDFSGALKAAIPAVQKMGNDSHQWLTLAILLESIGRCQLNLGQEKEAQSTYSKAYACYMDNSDVGEDINALRHIIIATHNTALSYLRVKHYDDVLFWTHRTDTLLRRYEKMEGAKSAFADQVQARVYLHYALALHGKGKPLLGRVEYQRYLGTDYGKSDDGRIDGTQYLMAAGRYREAADNYRDLDRILQSWGVTYSLVNMQRYLFPKYRANVGAGRPDSAIAVGQIIMDALDSAIVDERNSDAVELAVIYDTQRMENELAREKIALVQQRLLTTIAIAVLVILFLVVFLLHRQRSRRQLAQKNEELMEANIRAEEALRIKTNFIGQISHEIRTPLNILSGFTQVVLEQGAELDEESKKDIASQVSQNTQRITELVDKMLELSDLSSHTTIERNDYVTAAQIAQKAIQDSSIGTATHIDFDLQMEKNVETLMVRTNLHAATRALTQVLDNACKFTKPAESISQTQDTTSQSSKERVTLRVTCVEDMPMQLAFTVEDTGKGIPASESEHIFEKFVQLDNYYNGTGIGLTVARALARSLGGDIVLDTSYKQGARFVVTIVSAS